MIQSSTIKFNSVKEKILKSGMFSRSLKLTLRDISGYLDVIEMEKKKILSKKAPTKYWCILSEYCLYMFTGPKVFHYRTNWKDNNPVIILPLEDVQIDTSNTNGKFSIEITPNQKRLKVL